MKIFYIMGKSSTGKDTIFNKLLLNKELNLTRLVPYTTRPMRIDEKDGVDYHFLTDKEFDKLEEDGKIIESRTYDTVKGKWTYFTPKENLEDKSYITIGTLESYSAMKFVYKENLIPLYIELDNKIRLSRSLMRESKQANPNYEEVHRRFKYDEEDFSEIKLHNNGITTRFVNDNLNDCVRKIEKVIEEQRETVKNTDDLER